MGWRSLAVAAGAAWLAGASAGQESGDRWVWFEDRNGASPPALVLRTAEGERRIVAAADVLVIEYLPERSFGAHAQLAIDLADRNRVFLAFDALPAEAIESASLELALHQSALGTRAPFDVAMHLVRGELSETGTTWRSQPPFDEEPACRAPVGPEEGACRLDVTSLVRAWQRTAPPDARRLTFAMRVAEPREIRAPIGAGVDDAADAEIARLLDYAPDFAAAAARAREEDKEVLAVVVASFRGTELTEHERVLGVACLSDPAVRAAIAARCVPLLVRVSPNEVSLALAGEAPSPRLGKIALADYPPPSLLRIDREGRVVRALASIADFRAASALAFLGADAPPDAAEGSREHRELAERLRKAYPDIARCYAAPPVRAGTRGPAAARTASERAALLAGAADFLVACQLPDGSWPMGHPSYEVHREGIGVLCAHALLAAGRAEAEARALAWLTERIEPQDPEELNSFTAAYWLDYRLARHARDPGEAPRVRAAIDALVGGQMEHGAWSYSRSFGDGWRGGFGGWPVTELGRAHSMNTAIALDALARAAAAGFDVPEDALERGRTALLAMRTAPARFTYTWPEPRCFEEAISNVARAPAAECALRRTGGNEREDLRLAVTTFEDSLAALASAGKMTDSWLAPHGLCAYFRSFAWLHGARAARLLGGEDGERVLRRVANEVAGAIEPDGTWTDTLGLGKAYATAMAVLILDECGR